MPFSILQNPLFAALYIGFAVLVGFFGRRRVFGFWGFFLLSIFLTPLIIGLILILAAPDPDAREKERQNWLKMNGMR
ncbi:MAG TPA: hypothetical protein VHB25_12250 [Gemmatimonadaceae bacterium]|nr:hypothetical protein [Gemmatimonadaceae bacterium]